MGPAFRRDDGVLARQMIEENRLIQLHDRSMRNRKLLSEAKICGCFYCFKEFQVDEIVEWVDKSRTALCPFCGIDAVLDFGTDPADQLLLRQMHDRWFSRTVKL